MTRLSRRGAVVRAGSTPHITGPVVDTVKLRGVFRHASAIVWIVCAVTIACGDPDSGASGPLQQPELADSTVINDDREEASIVISPQLLLGSDSIDPAWHVVHMRSGYYVTGLYQRGSLGVWDARGRFVRVIGTEGRGPNELAGTVTDFYVDAGDSLHVADESGKWTVFSPTFDIVRQIRAAGGVLGNLSGTLFLSDGRVLKTQPAPGLSTSERFHVLNRDGRVLFSFGSTAAELGAGPRAISVRERLARVLADAGNGRFWTTGASEYRLELWDLDGRRLAVLERTASWFPPKRHGAGIPADAMLIPPRILSLHVDSHGLLWVLIMLPNTKGDVPGHPLESLDELDRFYDFRIEVIDPGAGKVVASRTADTEAESFQLFSRGGTGFRFTDDSIGRRFAEIVNVTVRRKQR